MTTPDYANNAPQGYRGDWRRGAPMGRPPIGDQRTAAQLETEFVAACAALSDALRLKENRPRDAYKPEAWQAAVESFRREKEELRILYKAAKAREAAPVKITLQRIRLDSGGYDSQGAYWGHGAPLYWASTPDGEWESTFRADDREDAKRQVREILPNARFYK